jgi:micrococcal nuclease
VKGLAGVLLLLVVLAVGCLQTSGNGSSGAGSVTVKVDRVVDGDTAKVFFEGRSEYVRYIGIDTPESVDPDSPVECFGPEAKEFNQSKLGAGTVRLEFDEDQRDRYGRLLAYVYVGDLMLNAELLRQGYAETMTIAPNDSRADKFREIEANARNMGLGMWSCPG